MAAREQDPGALAQVAEIVRALEPGIAFVSADGVQAQVDDRLCEVTGFGRDELIGRAAPFPYWPPEEREAIETALRTTLASTGPMRHRLTFMRRDGERFPAEVHTAPVYDRAGALLGFVGTLRDLTAQRAAERALLSREERFRAMADSAPAMLWMADPAGVATYVSDSWLRFRGRELADEVGDGWLAGVHPDDRVAVVRALRAAVARQESVASEYRVRDAAGAWRWIADSARPWRVEGRIAGYIGSRVDVTERHAAEEELRAREENHRALAREQAALRRVATAVAGGADSDELFRLVAAEAGDLLAADSARIVSYVGDEAVVMGTWGRTPPSVGARFHLRGRRTLALVRSTGRAARVDDYGVLAREDSDSVGLIPPGFRAGLAAPVTAAGHLWGALFVARVRENARFTDEDERRLSEFADLAGLAVSNAEALRRLDRQARTDPLTGLANHRAFHERLEAEGARASRHGRPLSVAVLDLDHFKRVNDTHGHAAGDEVLREVARRLSAVAREGELVGRIGGEELGWLLPETDGAGALGAAERARRAIAERPFEGVGRLTISAGVADLEQARAPGAMMALADGALYWAKARGRNQVCRYSPDVDVALSADERSRRIERDRALAGLRSLARLIDARHGPAAGHMDRVADMAARLAAELGWDDAGIARLTEAALLHDIGTIEVPQQDHEEAPSGDHGGPPHPVLGAEMTRLVLSPDQVAWLRGHHERMDGAGYPDGLRGADISGGARILAVAERWDELTWLDGPGDPLGVAEALEECRRLSGRVLCPAVVEALLRIGAANGLGPARG